MENKSNGIDKLLLAKVVEEVISRQNGTTKAPTERRTSAPRATTNTQPRERKPEKPRQERKPAYEPKEPPANSFTNGAVVTRIWANKTQLGDFIWRVDQRRVRTDGVGGPKCITLQPQHLADAIRGLYQAHQWIKKTERRLRWRRLWF